MFAKEIYIRHRNLLKKTTSIDIPHFSGSDECGINCEDNTYDFRQDSTLFNISICCRVVYKKFSSHLPNGGTEWLKSKTKII
jgi:hypothetical protein